MKILATLLIAGAFALGAADTNLIPDPAGAKGFKGWFNPARITASDGIITMTANTDPKINAYQKAQVRISLKGKEMQNRKLELSFKYRTQKLQGSFQAAVREAYGKGATYHGVTLKRWDVSKEWKSCKYTFTTRKNTSDLAFYLVGRYMKKGEKVELKDLKLIAK